MKRKKKDRLNPSNQPAFSPLSNHSDLSGQEKSSRLGVGDQIIDRKGRLRDLINKGAAELHLLVPAGGTAGEVLIAPISDRYPSGPGLRGGC